MANRIFLGKPPAHVKQFIIDHYASAPSELSIPLYFEGQEDGATVAMIAWNDMDQMPADHFYCNLECSTDGMSTWSAYDGEIIELDNCAGKRVYFRAPDGQPNTNGFYDDGIYILHSFKLEKAVKAGGNIQFLLESTGTRTDVPTNAFYQMFGMLAWDEETEETIGWCKTLTQAPTLPATTLAEGCYSSMFAGCTSLTQAPTLPATTLAEGCYQSMFFKCTSLTQAPTLPATTLADYCCKSMFSNCTSLAQAPALPAMTLAEGCYSQMFSYCTSLAQAPALPAMTLAEKCYSYMFDICTSLVSMDVSFTAWNPANATTYWMTNAGSQATETKTFTCPSGLPDNPGNSGIPSSWTRVDKTP